jgi:hypothetical protein
MPNIRRTALVTIALGLLSRSALAARVVVESAEESPRSRAVAGELRALGFDVQGSIVTTTNEVRVHISRSGLIHVYVGNQLRESLDGNDDGTVARRVAESLRVNAEAPSEPAAVLPSGAPPAVDRSRASEAPRAERSFRRHVIDLHPLNMVFGRVSTSYEGFVAKHHALAIGAHVETFFARFWNVPFSWVIAPASRRG